MAYKGFTLRLSESLYREVELRKRKSINEFVVEAIQEKVARERDEELRRGFATLAGEMDEETGAWIDAQRKAMKHVND